MARNTGKPSEQEFERIWTRLGKQVWLWRVPDAAEVKGRTGNIGTTRPAPSDYVIVAQGRISFAEVKSTTDDAAFRFSLLRKKPSAMASMITTAGGDYDVYVHRLKTNEWFCVPFKLIESCEKRSLSWSELERFKWNIPTT